MQGGAGKEKQTTSFNKTASKISKISSPVASNLRSYYVGRKTLSISVWWGGRKFRETGWSKSAQY